MKIALVSSLYAPDAFGGAERVAQDLAEALVAQGHSVSVICLSAEGRAEFAELNGVRIYRARLKNLYWPFPISTERFGKKVLWHLADTFNPAMGRTVGTLLDAIRPDVVNTHVIAGFSITAWLAAKRRGLPVVHTLHDQYLLCPYSTMFKDGRNCETRCFGCRIASAPRSRMTGRVDGVTGVSRFVLQRHLDYGLFSKASASVVYNSYQPPAGAEAGGGGRMQGPVRFGYLGRLDRTKGLHRLIDAFLGLARGAAELWIAGSGDPEYEAMLKQRTAGRDDVRWLGFVAPEAFLPQVQVLVVPSLWHEAMGRVVLEAYAFGLPVIGANRGGIPELADRDCGWIVDPDRDGELAAALQRCIDQPGRLAEMRPAALAASRRFSKAAMLEGYLAAYGSVMRPAASGRSDSVRA